MIFFAQHVRFVTSLGLHLIAPSEYTCITILARLELPFFFLPSSLYPTNSKKTYQFSLTYIFLTCSVHTQDIHLCTRVYVFFTKKFSFLCYIFSQLSLCCLLSCFFFRYITYMMHILLLHRKKNDSSTPFPLHQGKTRLLQKKEKSLKNTIPCFTLHSLQTQLSYFFLLSEHISFQCFFFFFASFS